MEEKRFFSLDAELKRLNIYSCEEFCTVITTGDDVNDENFCLVF